jgi:hypothetical protein
MEYQIPTMVRLLGYFLTKNMEGFIHFLPFRHFGHTFLVEGKLGLTTRGHAKMAVNQCCDNEHISIQFFFGTFRREPHIFENSEYIEHTLCHHGKLLRSIDNQ